MSRARAGHWWRSAGHPEPGPLACAENIKGAMRLSALNRAACARGLRPGQGVAEARAICPDLDVVPADPAADARLLEALADWGDRYTPLVGCDGPDGLFLDISGCAHLFGGERALLADCMARLFHLGFEASAAIAPNPALAWALARHHPGRIATPADIAKIMPGLPVAALRLPSEVSAALSRLGLKRVGDLVDAPRAPLTRRFGRELLGRIDRMKGLDSEPISPRRPVADIMSERRLGEPVSDIDAIGELVGRLAANLKETLAERGAGVRRAELRLFRVDGAVRRIEVGTARPLRDPARLCRLFAERLASIGEDFDAGFGFEMIRLSVPVFETLSDAQADFDGRGTDKAGFHDLADRLAARLGPARVLQPIPRDSHIPERAMTHLPLTSRKGPTCAVPLAPASAAARPLRLLSRPEPVTAVAAVPEGPPVIFSWRNARHRVGRAEGPERIAAEWWSEGEDALTRDYYRVEDEAGRRYWLFREGLYEREPGTPRWFLHGLFV
ncbi:Y-family DNA polymerase [Pseudohoeflea suaedae]|uniref:Y-family DNA polymerase n=1 Tax=Pseudohoeflea suaedae TaxID=877384 RepID=UPI0024530CAE|nr:DNA polymerase Y family protein [Pseudohoeflea suaedae]